MIVIEPSAIYAGLFAGNPSKTKGFLVGWYTSTEFCTIKECYPVESETLFRYIIRGYNCARSSTG